MYLWYLVHSHCNHASLERLLLVLKISFCKNDIGKGADYTRVIFHFRSKKLRICWMTKMFEVQQLKWNTNNNNKSNFTKRFEEKFRYIHSVNLDQVLIMLQYNWRETVVARETVYVVYWKLDSCRLYITFVVGNLEKLEDLRCDTRNWNNPLILKMRFRIIVTSQFDILITRLES